MTSQIAVVGPLHTYPGLRWCFNTGIPGDLRGPLKEQAFFGSYHAVPGPFPGPFPEAHAAKCAAGLNQSPIVEVFAANRWHFGELRRRIRVPDDWLVSWNYDDLPKLVCAAAHRIQAVER